MDELEISGKRYISAKLAAKEHKYHSDYIGQLVRGGKVAGQKVGRAWYVDAESLAEYLGKEVPPRGPVVKKEIVELEPEPVVGKAEEIEAPIAEVEVEEVATEVESEGVAEKSVAEPEARDISSDLKQDESETPFIMPLRKSGRHHVIAAWDQDTKAVTEKEEEVENTEQKFAEEFNAPEVVTPEEVPPTLETAVDIAEDENFIPVKITQTERDPEPEDSFYKVSKKGLRYVSGSSALAMPAVKKVPTPKQIAVRPNKSFALGLVKLTGVVVVVGALALGAGVLASYYLHSVTTIGEKGQTSSIVLSR